MLLRSPKSKVVLAVPQRRGPPLMLEIKIRTITGTTNTQAEVLKGVQAAYTRKGWFFLDGEGQFWTTRRPRYFDQNHELSYKDDPSEAVLHWWSEFVDSVVQAAYLFKIITAAEKSALMKNMAVERALRYAQEKQDSTMNEIRTCLADGTLTPEQIRSEVMQFEAAERERKKQKGDDGSVLG